MKEYIISVNLEKVGWGLTRAYFRQLWILTWELRYSSKIKGEQKKDKLIWVRGLMCLCKLVLVVQENFRQSRSVSLNFLKKGEFYRIGSCFKEKGVLRHLFSY